VLSIPRAKPFEARRIHATVILSEIIEERTAAAQLDALLAASGATEDELVDDFKEARRNRRKART
jgi:hypothetical protein